MTNTRKLQELFIERGLTLATAESCTGGNIAHLVTLKPGSSEYFRGAIVSYSNEVKVNVLGVNENDLMEFGAVSRQVALQMANGVRDLMDADYAVSTTGIAGPTGGSEENPVGTVWIGVSSANDSFGERFNFSGSRSEVIEKSTLKALQILENLVLKIELEND